MKRFLENDGIAGNLYDVTIEHRVVLSQEISLVHCIHDHGNHSHVRFHNSLESDLVNGQAALAGTASRTHRSQVDNRTDERVPSAHSVNGLWSLLFVGLCRFGVLDRY